MVLSLYNIRDDNLRDTADNLVTCWIRDGNYERYAPGPSTAMDGLDGGFIMARELRYLPGVGRKHLRMALDDPEARPRVLSLVKSFDAPGALAAQAEQDVAEVVNPTGKVIVFKDLARRLGGRLKQAEEAIAQALPTRATEEGRMAAEIVAYSENPRADLEELYQAVAYNAIAPGLEWSTEPEDISLLGELGSLKKSLKKLGKKAKKLAKPLAIAAAVVGGVLLAPAIIPAIGSAVSAVGGAIGSVVSSIFGKKRTPQQEALISEASGLDANAAALEAAGQATAAAQMRAQAMMLRTQADAPAPAQAAAPSAGVFDTVASLAMQIFAKKQAGDTAGATKQYEETVAYLKQQGIADAEARQLATQALAQVAAQSGPAAPPMMPTPAGAPPETPAREPAKGADVGTIAAIVAAALLLSG